MKTALGRNLHYQARLMGEMLLYTLLTTLVLLVWQGITTPVDYLADNLAISSVTYILFSALIWSAGAFLAMQTTFLPMALSLGTTRKASFWGSQIAKVVYALGTVCIGWMANICVGLLLPDAAFRFTGVIAVVVFCIVLTLASMMELIGALGKRFGKWGFILYVAVCATVGGVVGVVFASSEETGGITGLVESLFDTLHFGSMAWVLCAVLLGLTVLGTAICGMLYHKIEV